MPKRSRLIRKWRRVHPRARTWFRLTNDKHDMAVSVDEFQNKWRVMRTTKNRVLLDQSFDDMPSALKFAKDWMGKFS